MREVTPFGLLFGRSNYLVAQEDAEGGPRNWRLDRIHDVEALGVPAVRPDGFSLQDYADESFGIYHDAVAQQLAEAGIKVVQDRCLMVDHRRLSF